MQWHSFLIYSSSFTWAGYQHCDRFRFALLTVAGQANQQLNHGTYTSSECCPLSDRWSRLRNTGSIVACYSRTLRLEGGMSMLHTLQIQWCLHLDKPGYLQKQDAPSVQINQPRGYLHLASWTTNWTKAQQNRGAIIALRLRSLWLVS